MLSVGHQRWNLREASPEVTKTLANQLQLHPLVARCLALRVSDPERRDGYDPA